MSYYQMGGSGGGGQPNLQSRIYPPLAQPVRSAGMQDCPVGGPGGFYPPVAQPVGIQHMRAPPPPAVVPGGGGGIRVRIKPEYRMAPGVELSPLDGVIPRSTFHFDFGLERQVLEDNDQDKPFPPPQRVSPPPPSVRVSAPAPSGRVSPTVQVSSDYPPLPSATASVRNPAVVSSGPQYLSEDFPSEAERQARIVYKDDEKKVMEFCNNYSRMKEMGFVTESITSSLAMYDNDVRRAVNHLTHGNGT